MTKYAKYKDKEAGPWQGMFVGQVYEILEETFPKDGGAPWYKTERTGNAEQLGPRWTSSLCFEPPFEK